jgi:hypothetical protein
MNIQHELFLDAKTASALLTQLLGPRRFGIFASEALDQLGELSYLPWSGDVIADYVNGEMEKNVWRDRKPSLYDFHNLVEESRKKCQEYDLCLQSCHAILSIRNASTEDEFDFAVAMLKDLLEYFTVTTRSTLPPPVFVTVEGKDRYSQIFVNTFLSGVGVEIEFLKTSAI